MRPQPHTGARAAPASELTAAVRDGLAGPGPKTLPSRFLYDELGSALFEAIGQLPEYGLTRADERILRRHCRAIVGLVPSPVAVAELGSGNGRKTRWILDVLSQRQPVTYLPIDISPAALARCAVELGGLPGVRVVPVGHDYLSGLSEAGRLHPETERLLVLFLGSTIGNFGRREGVDFLRDVRVRLKEGDGLLLGTDLVNPVPRMLAAYDDPLGVTAAFDLNLLVRINRELDADFHLDSFAHDVRWRASERRIEMHLVARRTHTVAIRALDLEIRFREGESIWTESSHKYTQEEPISMAARAGFECAGQWLDRQWAFAETLFLAR